MSLDGKVCLITGGTKGIGATTAIFSFTNAVILRSLPVQKPSELVLLRYASKKGNIFEEMGYQARPMPGKLSFSGLFPR